MQEKANSFSIKQWSNDDKPREKLYTKGKAVLSDAELIAILIGSGSREESAVALSKKILASVNNNLNDLGRLSIKQLMQFKGIGEAKAIAITAALEIGRRRKAVGYQNIQKIGSSKDAFELLSPRMAELPHEEFWIIYLNNSNKIIHTAQLSKGGLTGTMVDVRVVLKEALGLGAVGLVLAHNHPSGTLKPSAADRQVTQKIKVAAATVDIKVLDHIILAQQRYFSFADNGLL